MTETFYDLLDVPADASTEEIDRAFRRQVRENHPDRSDDPDATERMQRINRAREVLTDPDERRRYDDLGHEAYVGGATGRTDGASGGSASAGGGDRSGRRGRSGDDGRTGRRDGRSAREGRRRRGGGPGGDPFGEDGPFGTGDPFGASDSFDEGDPFDPDDPFWRADPFDASTGDWTSGPFGSGGSFDPREAGAGFDPRESADPGGDPFGPDVDPGSVGARDHSWRARAGTGTAAGGVDGDREAESDPGAGDGRPGERRDGRESGDAGPDRAGDSPASPRSGDRSPPFVSQFVDSPRSRAARAWGIRAVASLVLASVLLRVAASVGDVTPSSAVGVGVVVVSVLVAFVGVEAAGSHR